MMCPDVNAIRAGRTVFGRSMFPRMVEIIQMLGTGGLMALPAEADFESEIGAEIERYFATDSADAPRPGPAVPPGVGRVVQRFQRAAGAVRADVRRDPVRNSITLYQNYNREPFKQKSGSSSNKRTGHRECVTNSLSLRERVRVRASLDSRRN